MDIELLETVEHETGPQPQWTVLLLHGLGDSGDGWAPLVPELLRKDWPALRFVFPHAPIRPVTINGGMRMRAWYDIVDLEDIDNRADEAGVLASAAQVEALIARESERGVPRTRIILSGFSQGGAIAMAVALSNPKPLGGLIALSTYLPMPDRLIGEDHPPHPLPPVFMAHGRHDAVLPHRAGELAADHLGKLGYDVEWHSYPMGHEACLEELTAISDWLTLRFRGA
ncbi:MAG TPA: alpha/beta fold hydrolase [Sporichthyaceae bacterium]|nr:alpha/beta fold hydrolase [Sporichthyaceae bacterium]